MAFTNPSYVDYRKYGGKLRESDFYSSLDDAVYTVSSLTFTRSENPPEVMYERVKRCVCELVDVKHSYKQVEAVLPKGVGSVNNDGYSISRNAHNSSGSSELTEQQDYEMVCRKYLLMPVNLMYAGT